MKIVKGYKTCKESGKGSVVTIGVFDGIHIGHRRILSMVSRRARQLGAKSIAVTFDPHPLKVLCPGYPVPSLISLAHRIRLMEEMGIDEVLVLNFTKAVSKMQPEDFVKRILIEKLRAKEAFVGENFYFGKGGKTGAPAMKKIACALNLKVNIVKGVKKNGRIVSSSTIRTLIMNGKLNQASVLLGRNVSVLGTVVSGIKLARILGFPTANINPHHEVIPPCGVYAVKVRYGRRTFGGVLNIGKRPTFYSPRDEEPTIEVHVFGFNKRIYGKDIEVMFVRKIRSEKRFGKAADLIRQIRKDAQCAKKVLYKKETVC